MNCGDEFDLELCCVDQTEVFRALAEPSRMALLLRLAALGRAAKVSELAPCCAKDLSVVSRHLACLRKAGVLESEKTGREVWYRLTPSLPALLRQMAEALEKCCPGEGEC